AAKVLVGKTPASLANTNVVANAMFGAVSGAAVAAAAAVGTVMTPRMKEDGYDPKWSAAVNVASAPAGMLIPPSNTFIVYSLVSGASVSALFMAGLIPGIIWALACIVVVMLTYRRFSTPQAAQHVSFKDGLLVIWRAVPSLLMIIIVVGGIVAGFFTATESASRSEEHTSELQSRENLVCRLLLEKKKKKLNATLPRQHIVLVKLLAVVQALVT